jgi:hypothetical protein
MTTRKLRRAQERGDGEEIMIDPKKLPRTNRSGLPKFVDDNSLRLLRAGACRSHYTATKLMILVPCTSSTAILQNGGTPVAMHNVIETIVKDVCGTHPNTRQFFQLCARFADNEKTNVFLPFIRTRRQ